jgi:phosphoenolpyruvate synthase/pyruvate phosphate dikinase
LASPTLSPSGASPRVRWLGEAQCHDLESVGPKAANLSRLASRHRVPPGFAITADAARSFDGGIRDSSLASLVETAYCTLSDLCGQKDCPVAVRSSAVDEDGQGTSFAGQHDTYLNVRGIEAVLDAVVRCVDSARTGSVLAYRENRGLSVVDTKIAVLIQALVASDVSAVVFSANPVSSSRDEVVINASWGLGESVVGGTVTPDTYVVSKSPVRMTSRTIANKARMTVLEQQGTREVAVPRFVQDVPCLSEEQAFEMAALASALEAQLGWHTDIECAIAGNQLYLLQCRPITTLR